MRLKVVRLDYDEDEEAGGRRLTDEEATRFGLPLGSRRLTDEEAEELGFTPGTFLTDEAVKELRALKAEDFSDLIGAKARFFDQIDIKKMHWLWEDRFPIGVFSAIDGDPGVSKSLLSVDVAARLSRGGTWPDGAKCPVAKTLLVSLEDDAAVVVKPRLMAAGANLSNVMVLGRMRDEDGTERAFTIPDDVWAIEEVIVKYGIQVVVVDPLSAALSESVDSWKDQSLRRGLNALIDLAERRGVTVIAIRHFNKDTSQSALHRGGGSIAGVAAARVGHAVVREEDETVVFGVTKTNYGRRPKALRYEIEEVAVKGTDRMWPRLKWLGEAGKTIEAALADAGPKKPKKFDTAGEDIDRLFEKHPKGVVGEVRRAGPIEEPLLRHRPTSPDRPGQDSPEAGQGREDGGLVVAPGDAARRPFGDGMSNWTRCSNLQMTFRKTPISNTKTARCSRPLIDTKMSIWMKSRCPDAHPAYIEARLSAWQPRRGPADEQPGRNSGRTGYQI